MPQLAATAARRACGCAPAAEAAAGATAARRRPMAARRRRNRPIPVAPGARLAGKMAASAWRAARSCAGPTASNWTTTSNARAAARAASRALRA